MSDEIPAELLAERFHEAYERLAPLYGYETRLDSAVSWADVPERNRQLMVAVCREIGPLFASVVHDCCLQLDEARAWGMQQRSERIWPMELLGGRRMTPSEAWPAPWGDRPSELSEGSPYDDDGVPKQDLVRDTVSAWIRLGLVDAPMLFDAIEQVEAER